MRGSIALCCDVKKNSNKLQGEIIHKLEPKELQVTQSSEGLRATDIN